MLGKEVVSASVTPVTVQSNRGDGVMEVWVLRSTEKPCLAAIAEWGICPEELKFPQGL